MKRISITAVTMTATALLLTTACAPDSNDRHAFTPADPKMTARVIYGNDGRLDLYQVTDDRLKTWADSAVALVKNSDLTVTGSQTTFKGRNYGTDMNLCPTEKYREQDSAAFCSGSLVGPDLILTAGHCITSASACQETSFVFGFSVKAEGILPRSVASSEVYRCKEIVKHVLEHAGADFAVIRLDRAVTNHKPLSLRSTGDVGLTDSLVVMGHPVGLPLKITGGGTVRNVNPPNHFVANLDTYGGNSGSAVINASTGVIEGVLVRGEQDFESRGGCTVSKTCAEGACRGEDVTKVSVVRPYVPAIVPAPVTPPPALQEEVFKSDAKIKIPDNNSIGVSSRITVTSLPAGRKVTVTYSIQHTYIGDLVVKVIAPDGKSVIVHQRAGGSADDLNKSVELTSQLGHVAVAGDYKLVIQDLAAIDVGTLIRWEIKFH